LNDFRKEFSAMKFNPTEKFPILHPSSLQSSFSTFIKLLCPINSDKQPIKPSNFHTKLNNLAVFQPVLALLQPTIR
jgi:hypothetical protein